MKFQDLAADASADLDPTADFRYEVSDRAFEQGLEDLVEGLRRRLAQTQPLPRRKGTSRAARSKR